MCWWSQNSFIDNNQKDASFYQSLQVWTIKSIKVCKNFCEIEFPVSVEFPLFVLSFYESTFAYIICYLQLTASFILFKNLDISSTAIFMLWKVNLQKSLRTVILLYAFTLIISEYVCWSPFMVIISLSWWRRRKKIAVIKISITYTYTNEFRFIFLWNFYFYFRLFNSIPFHRYFCFH